MRSWKTSTESLEQERIRRNMDSSAEEKLLKEKREKARQLLYKKPIVKELNLYAIKDKLFDIQGEC